MRITIPEQTIVSMLEASKIDKLLVQLWDKHPDGSNVIDGFMEDAARHWSNAQRDCELAGINYNDAQTQFLDDLKAGRNPRSIDDHVPATLGL